MKPRYLLLFLAGLFFAVFPALLYALGTAYGLGASHTLLPYFSAMAIGAIMPLLTWMAMP